MGVLACGDGLLGISNGVAAEYPDMMFSLWLLSKRREEEEG